MSEHMPRLHPDDLAALIDGIAAHVAGGRNQQAQLELPPMVASSRATLGQMIRSKRKYLGITQEELEATTGVTQTNISQIETGRVSLPSFASLDALAAALELDANTLKIAAGYPVVRLNERAA